MHFDMSAEPARGRRCAETRKSLHFATVSGCVLEPPGIRYDIQAVRHAGIATILDLPSIAAAIVAGPHRLSHSRSCRPAKTTTWISTGRRLRANTTSDGRQRLTPLGVTTSGRLSSTGWASIASSNSSSVRAGLPRLSSWKGVPFSRSTSRTLRLRKPTVAAVPRAAAYRSQTPRGPRRLVCDHGSRTKPPARRDRPGPS